jgi:hypothetical protein
MSLEGRAGCRDAAPRGKPSALRCQLRRANHLAL